MSIEKRTRLALRAVAVMLAAFCVLSLFGCKKGSDVPLSDGLSMIEGVAVYDEDVAMQSDHFTVTPGMMAYFFYTIGGTMMAEMEAEQPFDESLNLHDQQWDDTRSWYDVMMNATLEHVSLLLIYNEAALQAQEALTDAELEEVENTLTRYRTVAAIEHDMGIDDYLQTLYGPLITEADFRAVLEMESLANRYSIELTERLEGEITVDEAQDYAEQAGLDDDTPSRNVAYLYVGRENGTLPEAKVTAALSALQASPTLDTLEGLSTYGLVGEEKNLTPDNSGIPEIGAWLFAEGRKMGDVGRVDLGGACYVLLYTDNGITYAEVSARMALFDEAFAAWYNGWVETLTFGYNYDCLDGYDVQK